MTIRKLTQEDLPALVILFDAYRVWYGQPSSLSRADTFLKERIARKESMVFGALDKEDHLVGFTQLYPLFSSTRMGRIWLLNDLFVVPNYRGQGISIQLIDRAKRLAADTNSVGLLLETEKTNDIGNNLYPRTGFTLEEDFNHYFWSAKI
ncbi:MAG: GNAT family N-acetyltransferase [Saprospiraceae bacterium]|nr:GNAT family N-acetyltransferase [Saprospiraceae bacterium]